MEEGGSREAPASAYRSYFCAVVLVVVGALVYLWGHVMTIAQFKDLEALRVEQQVLLDEQDRLKADISGLKRSSRIRKIASQKLGMAFPAEPPRNLYLQSAKPPVSGTKAQDAD